MIDKNVIAAILQDDCSKTKRKAAMHELQKLAIALVSLKPKQIEALPISDYFKDELLETKQLSAKEAIKRQHQYLGKLMRQEDFEALLEHIKIERLPI